MALTVNLKPSGFQPVGGWSLIYQFTEASLSGKTNYRVELEFNGLGLPKFEFRPDAALVVYCEIGPILASVLKMSNLTADRLKTTYVKYQAVWNEGSDTQISLFSDAIIFYVGNNHILNKRTKFDIKGSDGNALMLLAGGKFLFHDNTKLISGRKFFVDFLTGGTVLGGDNLPNNARISYYNRDTLTTTNVSVFDGSGNGMQSLEVTISTPGRYYLLITDNAGTTFYGRLSVDVIEECSNPVYLRWINDYGGLQHFMFEYNQVQGFQISSNKRNKELNVNAYGITFEQWIMLSEINTQGLIYNDSFKIGQFVQDVTDYANPVSLVVIPNEQATETKRVKHNFDLTIRYPRIPNNLVT